MEIKLTLVAAVFMLSLGEIYSFEFYWNIPTFMCKRYDIHFVDFSKKYSITQNDKDHFRGNQITILYDPGFFPAILQNSSSLEYFYRNGGIPQEGNLRSHLNQLAEHINQAIPDENFSGLAVIDFESWRPIFRQNFGVLQPYKNLSIKKQKEKHPNMSDKKVLAEARRKFEEAGKTFMLESLWLLKEIRPKAKWGYYAFPYCFNGKSTKNPELCAANVDKENNQ